MKTRITAWFISLAFLASGAFLAYSGYSKGNTGSLLGGVVLLALGIFGVWIMVQPVLPKEKRFAGDSAFQDIHRFCRETLVPLGFEEQIKDTDLFPQITYTRPNISIWIDYDIRDKEYGMSVTAEGLSHFGALTPDLKSKEARAETFKRFQAWLKENQIN